MTQKIALALLIFGLTLISSLSWSLSNPVGSSPDEGSHLVSIWCTTPDKTAKCVTGANNAIVHSSQLSGIDGCYIHDGGNSASCLTNQVETFTTAYPVKNRYFKILSYFTNDNVKTSVLKMRLLNSLIFSTLLTLSFFILRKDIYVGTFLAGATISIPLGWYLISSISTSSWLLIASIYFLPFLFSIFTKKKLNIFLSFLGLGVICFLYTSSRSDGVLFLIISFFAGSFILIQFMVDKLNHVPKYNNYTKYFKIITPVYFLSSFRFAYKTCAEIIAYSKLALYSTTGPVTYWEIVYRFPSLFTGIWGSWGLGSLEVDMPSLVSSTSLVLAFAIIYISLSRSVLSTKISLFYLLYFLIFITITFLYGSQLAVGQWLQPRYIAPLILTLVSISFVGTKVYDFIVLKNQFIIISILSIAIFSVSLHTNLRRYTHGLDNQILDLNNQTEWWWETSIVSPMAVFFAGSLAFAMLWLLNLKYILRRQLN